MVGEKGRLVQLSRNRRGVPTTATRTWAAHGPVPTHLLHGLELHLQFQWGEQTLDVPQGGKVHLILVQLEIFF